MNILILTHTYPDENNLWRGIFVRDQADALSTVHNVTVVYFRGDNSRLTPFKKASWTENIRGTVTEYTVTVPRSLPVINQLFLLMGVYRFISGNILKHMKIDLIHSHMSYPGGFLGTIIQRRKGIHNIVTEHSWVNKHFRSFVHRICVLYTLNNCSRIVAVSKALKENIRQFTQRPISVIPNLVSEERFNISGRKSGEIINFGILGSYDSPVKGLDVLLTAVSLKPDNRIHLHIGGKGSLLEAYKSMASELGIDHLCTFHGEVPPGKVPDFFSGLDIYVLASRKETFGVVVLEALASGIPVISTRCGGPEDIMTTSTGIMVDPENAKSLSEAITFMLQNQDSFNRPEIRRYVLDQFGSKAFLWKMQTLYREITSLPLTKQSS